MLLTVILIISFPSPTHSFILGLKPPFSANPSHCSLSFSSSGLTTLIPQIKIASRVVSYRIERVVTVRNNVECNSNDFSSLKRFKMSLYDLSNHVHF